MDSFLNYNWWTLGNDANIIFWEDEWLFPITLKSLYPKIHQLTWSINGLVNSQCAHSTGIWNWGIIARRAINQSIANSKNNLLQDLNTGTIDNTSSDTPVWLLTKDGNYLVRSFYDSLIIEESLPLCLISFGTP